MFWLGMVLDLGPGDAVGQELGAGCTEEVARSARNQGVQLLGQKPQDADQAKYLPLSGVDTRFEPA